MPLRETEAIILRTYRLGEADKIVSVFTRQWGRLRAVATGARRPKSRYGSTLEPLSYVRLWLFERENRDLLRMNSAELMESFFDMQKEYRVQIAAQYVSEVAERFLSEREVNERAFRLMLAVLRAFKRSREVNRPLLYFNFWLLRLEGFLPDLEHCLECGRQLGEEVGFYGQGAEGLLCATCRTVAAKQSVSAQARQFAQTARQATLDQWLAQAQVPPGCREARLFLEEVIDSHAEKRLVTRSLLADEV
jgi:DNA repair protein RecO (recombination protein O)